MRGKSFESCALCGLRYNTSLQRDKTKIFICADCAEKKLARMQRRRPRLIYRKSVATVKYEGST